MQRHPHTLAPRADTAPLEGITVLRPGAAGLQFCKLYSPDVVGEQLAGSGASSELPQDACEPLSSDRAPGTSTQRGVLSAAASHPAYSEEAAVPAAG